MESWSGSLIALNVFEYDILICQRSKVLKSSEEGKSESCADAESPLMVWEMKHSASTSKSYSHVFNHLAVIIQQ